MMRPWRHLAVALWLGILAGCDDGDLFAPRLVAGTWTSVQPPVAEVLIPDTLMLDGRGGGRMHVQVYTGQDQRTWVASPVRYRMESQSILIQYCLRYGPNDGDCEPGAWQLRGRLADDDTMYIGPASPISSVGPRPWVRRRR
jgi:hypothetical protein